MSAATTISSAQQVHARKYPSAQLLALLTFYCTPIIDLCVQELTAQFDDLRFLLRRASLLLKEGNKLGNITVHAQTRAHIVPHISNRHTRRRQTRDPGKQLQVAFRVDTMPTRGIARNGRNNADVLVIAQGGWGKPTSAATSLIEYVRPEPVPAMTSP